MDINVVIGDFEATINNFETGINSYYNFAQPIVGKLHRLVDNANWQNIHVDLGEMCVSDMDELYDSSMRQLYFMVNAMQQVLFDFVAADQAGNTTP